MTATELERAISAIVSTAIEQSRRCENADRRLRIEVYAVADIMRQVAKWDNGGANGE